nr:diguanylate cyclase [Oceanobacter mangrovi]
MGSLEEAFDIDQEQLEVTVQDYSVWDDTWNYIRNRDAIYIESNFVADTFVSLHLNNVIILDAQQQPIDIFLYDAEEERLSTPKNLDNDTFQELQQLLSLDGPRSGIIKINGQASIVAAHPVLPSNRDQPSNGWLIFSRSIEADSLATKERLTRLQVNLLPWVDNSPALDAPVDEPRTTFVRCLYSPLQKPVLCLEISDPNTRVPDLLGSEVWKELVLLGMVPAMIFALILRLIVSPLKRAEAHLRETAETGKITPFPVRGGLRIAELVRAANSHNQMVETIRLQNTQLKELSRTDSLTSVLNRRGFDDRLLKAWERLHLQPLSKVLILVDIDHFKRYNDSYGHPRGDMVLQQVARALGGIDTNESLARWGGEEFSLLLQAGTRKEVEEIARRIHEPIERIAIAHHSSPTAAQLTISVGIAWIHQQEGDDWLNKFQLADWVKCADLALYDAKASGRNQSCVRELRYCQELIAETPTPNPS